MADRTGNLCCRVLASPQGPGTYYGGYGYYYPVYDGYASGYYHGCRDGYHYGYYTSTYQGRHIGCSDPYVTACDLYSSIYPVSYTHLTLPTTPYV